MGIFCRTNNYGGHPTYRHITKLWQIIEKIPFTKELFAHVDWTEDYGLGRLRAEINTQKRLAKIGGK
jgi:hypothetical protein